MPPLGVARATSVRLRGDGEYELIGEGELFGDEDYEELSKSKIALPDQQEIDSAKYIPISFLEVAYDQVNFSPDEIRPLIESLNEVIPTDEKIVVRKSEIPVAVIWILIGGISGGFISRLGEVLADKTISAGHSLLHAIKDRFLLLLKQRTNRKTDVVFGIPLANSETLVEAAVEDANQETIAEVWESLPKLYAIVTRIIKSNPKDFFQEAKFLYNPVTRSWEINYLAIRKTRRIILGPRYYDQTHPLWHRWEENKDKATGKSYVSLSLTTYPEE